MIKLLRDSGAIILGKLESQLFTYGTELIYLAYRVRSGIVGKANMTEWANFRQVSLPNSARPLFVFVFPTRAANLDVQDKTTQTDQKPFRELTIEVNVLWPSRKTPTHQDLTSGKARFTMDGAGEEDRVRRLITRRGRPLVSESGSAFPTLPLL